MELLHCADEARDVAPVDVQMGDEPDRSFAAHEHATRREVLDHLFYHAWRQGAVAVTGRLDPRFMQALSDKYCLLHRRGPWVLVKANKPELVRAFETGTAWFSRLDGEWSLRF